ncbi:hypothetical protein ALC53_04792 [Atta colombica]|uniref:Uncharacterized protein n=1 Tax=Atta colombica TaxID=520822 RepID=A0A195BIR7_9HYME|nr:hypothetical protein ALC53_04792 [Atta colombica]
MGATVLLERRDKGEKYIERRGERAKRRVAARTYVRRPPPTSGRRAVTPVYPQHIISETVERGKLAGAGGWAGTHRSSPPPTPPDTSIHPSLHPRLLSTTGTSKPSHGVVAANLVCELQNPPPPTRAYK